MLEDSYSKQFGRPAKEPEMMAKLLILQYLYNLSDVKVIEEASLNLAYMWFIGINPDEDLPDASLLAKFRTQRLKEIGVDHIITEVVRQCVDNGLIKGTGLTIDTTHAKANTVKLVPERIMKHLSKKIFKNIKQESGEISPEINTTKFNYNKDSDQWFCVMGNHTIDRKRCKGSRGQEVLKYKFDKVMCKDCPNKVECAGKNKTVKCLEVGINTADYYEYSQRANTPDFKEKYRKRSSHEWKNGEMKRFHGLDRARGYGLKSMSMQAKLTALAVNLKRIAALVSFLFEHLLLISGKSIQLRIV